MDLIEYLDLGEDIRDEDEVADDNESGISDIEEEHSIDSGSENGDDDDDDVDVDDDDDDENEEEEWMRVEHEPGPPVRQGRFQENVGVIPPVEGLKDPIDFFNLFFTLEFWNLLVTETNRYAHQLISRMDQTGSLTPFCRMGKWIDLTIPEMKCFIGIHMNMGVTSLPDMTYYWSKKSLIGTSWFGRIMSRNRFQAILRCFHVVDNSTLPVRQSPDYMPDARFRPLVRHFNRISTSLYKPHKYLSVDESLVGTRVNSAIKQYMPQKRHSRFGVKFWSICDSVNFYCLAIHCYLGKRFEGNYVPFGLGGWVVDKMLQLAGLFGKWYHVCADNLFPSPTLADHLSRRRVFLTGTLRRKADVPKELKTCKLNVNEEIYFRREGTLLLGFKPTKSKKRPVLMLSNFAVARDVAYKGGQKQEMGAIYNKYKGGIDENDAMLYRYLDERRNLRSWKKIAFNILQRMVLNAYVLYKENADETPMSRLDFHLSVIASLTAETQDRDMVLRKLPGRRKIALSVQIGRREGGEGLGQFAQFAIKACMRTAEDIIIVEIRNLSKT